MVPMYPSKPANPNSAPPKHNHGARSDDDGKARSRNSASLAVMAAAAPSDARAVMGATALVGRNPFVSLADPSELDSCAETQHAT